jgi:RNA polymerase sigma-70 factor (ECF subfamily)
MLAGDTLIGVMALDIADGQIQEIRSIVNPEKLSHVGPVGDVRGLLRGRDRQR